MKKQRAHLKKRKESAQKDEPREVSTGVLNVPLNTVVVAAAAVTALTVASTGAGRRGRDIGHNSRLHFTTLIENKCKELPQKENTSSSKEG